MGGFWCYFLDFFGLVSPERLRGFRADVAPRQPAGSASGAEGERAPSGQETAGVARVAA